MFATKAVTRKADEGPPPLENCVGQNLKLFNILQKFEPPQKVLRTPWGLMLVRRPGYNSCLRFNAKPRTPYL